LRPLTSADAGRQTARGRAAARSHLRATPADASDESLPGVNRRPCGVAVIGGASIPPHRGFSALTLLTTGTQRCLEGGVHRFREHARRRPRALWLWTRRSPKRGGRGPARLRERSARELATVAAAALAAGVALEFFIDPRGGDARLFERRLGALGRDQLLIGGAGASDAGTWVTGRCVKRSTRRARSSFSHREIAEGSVETTTSSNLAPRCLAPRRVDRGSPTTPSACRPTARSWCSAASRFRAAVSRPPSGSARSHVAGNKQRDRDRLLRSALAKRSESSSSEPAVRYATEESLHGHEPTGWPLRQTQGALRRIAREFLERRT
jgi:hypothetical protein